MADSPNLPSLLAPASVALVGASADPDRPSGRPLAYLLRDGWAGHVYPVNPRHTEILGHRCWPSLSELPVVPEHVYVLSPTETVIETVERCAALGVPVVSVLAGGFGETGATGLARQEHLLRVARTGGVRLLGPNAMGIVDTRTGFTLTANAALGEGRLRAGSTFVASQSGSMIGSLISRGRARGLNFAGLVGVGAELDLSIGEICSATLTDPTITSYALFLETLGNADTLREFALAAADRGKPVTVYKLGRSQAASDLVVTHTGAITGEDDIATAFLADCGMARVDTLEGLLEGSLLADRLGAVVGSRSPRVGVLTATGGGAAMIVDQLGIRGIDVRAPSPETLRQLEDRVGFTLNESRIVDLTLRGTAVQPMSTALEIMRVSGEYDLVIQVLGSSATTDPDKAVGPALATAPHGTPLAVFCVPEAPAALSALALARVPAFRTPEACADAVAALLRRRRPRVPRPLAAADSGPPSPSLEGPPRTMDAPETAHLLASLEVSLVATYPVDDHLANPRCDYPVVLKATGAGLEHKTELGAVVVAIPDPKALRAEVAAMRARLDAAGVAMSQGQPPDRPQLVVEPMVEAVAEVLVGFIRDPQAGALVLLAPGGTQTQLSTQRSLRLAPVDMETAREMIQDVPSLARVLDGYRNQTKGDVDALARVLVSLSRLAAAANVREAELNPVMVGTDGATAVDALIRVGT